MARRPCRRDRDWLPSGQFDVPFARASVDLGAFFDRAYAGGDDLCLKQILNA